MRSEPEWARDPEGVLARRRHEDVEAEPYVSGCLSLVSAIGCALVIMILGALGYALLKAFL